MKRSLALTVSLAAGVTLTAFAQSPQDIDALKKQVQALQEGQKALERDLQQVKAVLQQLTRPAGPAADAAIPIAGAPVRGNANARVTMVEFSDFQCPFCGKYTRETWPQIENEYVKTGKMKVVFIDFPLESIHPQAFKAAEAANCAAEQRKYWEMHDHLFANQTALAATQLPEDAKALGLDAASFQQCLDTGKHAAAIRREMAEGQKVGINGTPTFFVGLSDAKSTLLKSTRVIVGAQPYSAFHEAIEAVLAAPAPAGPAAAKP